MTCGATLSVAAVAFATPDVERPSASNPTPRTASPVDEGRSTANAAPTADAAPATGVARPDRRLLVAAQYASRYALDDADAAVTELTFPHGLTDLGDNAGILATTGGLLTGISQGPTVMTMLLVLEYEPLPWILSPFLDAGAGGYLVLGRGKGRTEAQRIEWLWASSVSAGVKASLDRVTPLPVSLRVYGQAVWVEPPFVPLATVFSSWGLGVGVEYRFNVPDVHLIRQFSHGDGMADGW